MSIYSKEISNNKLGKVRYSEVILSKVKENGILEFPIKVDPNTVLCTVSTSDNCEDIVYSNISGYITEINLNVSDIHGGCTSNSWIAILIKSHS